MKMYHILGIISVISNLLGILVMALTQGNSFIDTFFISLLVSLGCTLGIINFVNYYLGVYDEE